MSTAIHFTWKDKSYSAHVQREHIGGTLLWVMEVENGKTFIMTQKRQEWYCAELDKKLCTIIGRAIERTAVA